ncbi:MAG: hypothetical protein GX321_07490 [Clostridiales bacterium]|nr:hypothetical protein [Clostridiales bacterium]
MRTKRITIIVCAFFYIILLTLTFSARRIHNASLPRVTVVNLEFERFEDKVEAEGFEGEPSLGNDPLDKDNKEKNNDIGNSHINRMNFKLSVGIPKELYENHKIYVIRREIVNGEERNIAREVTNLEIGQSNDKFYEVIRGLSSLDQVVLTGQDLIQDGSEVYVEE